jgi:hypothetical protein
MASPEVVSDTPSKEEPWVESKTAGDPLTEGVGSNSGDELKSNDVGVGELAFEEYTQGGLGRHLGIVSTMFLVYAVYFTYIQPN